MKSLVTKGHADEETAVALTFEEAVARQSETRMTLFASKVHELQCLLTLTDEEATQEVLKAMRVEMLTGDKAGDRIAAARVLTSYPALGFGNQAPAVNVTINEDILKLETNVWKDKEGK